MLTVEITVEFLQSSNYAKIMQNMHIFNWKCIHYFLSSAILLFCTKIGSGKRWNDGLIHLVPAAEFWSGSIHINCQRRWCRSSFHLRGNVNAISWLRWRNDVMTIADVELANSIVANWIVAVRRIVISRRVTEQEAQLMLTIGAMRLEVSRGQQTWYHFGSVATFR